MTITIIKPKTEEVLACVARFKELKRCETGLPDMELPEGRRAFYNVLGFEQPRTEGEFSPFGDAVKAPISHVKAGFGLSYIAAEPGKGVLMHAHDTIETFMVMKGVWKIEWEGADKTEHVLMGPLDFIAVPIGVHRRFECVEPEQGHTEGLLLAIISGDAPAAIPSEGAIERMYESGLWKREAIAA